MSSKQKQWEDFFIKNKIIRNVIFILGMAKLFTYYNKSLVKDRSSLDILEEIINQSEKETVDRVTYAFKMKMYSSDAILILAKRLASRRETIEAESIRFNKYKEKFLYSIVTDDNRFYTTIEASLNRLRSLLSPIMQLINKSLPTRHPTQAECEKYGIEQHLSIQESFLSKGCYIPDLFPDLFPDELRGFITEYCKYLEQLDRGLNDVKNLIEAEKQVKGDGKMCNMLLDKFIEKLLKNNDISMLDSIPMEELLKKRKANALCSSLKSSSSTEAFAMQTYHAHTPKELSTCCCLEFAVERRMNGLSATEQALWQTDVDAVMKARRAVANFDKFLPENIKKGDVSKYVCAFITEWIKAKEIKTALSFFKDNYHGKYNIAAYSTVNRNRSWGHDNKEDAASFIGRINSFFCADDMDEAKTKQNASSDIYPNSNNGLTAVS